MATGFASSVTSVQYTIAGIDYNIAATATGPSPFTTTANLGAAQYGTYRIYATPTWSGPTTTTPPSPPLTFTYAPTCTPTTTTTTTIPVTTATTTLPPAAAALTLSVPTNVVPGELITGSVTNVLPSDTITVASGATIVQTLVSSASISFRAPAAGTYSASVSRNGTTMSSAALTVAALPSLAVSGSMKEGFPLNATIAGPLDASDRVRIDTLGQAEICAACTDPAVNKPAARASRSRTHQKPEHTRYAYYDVIKASRYRPSRSIRSRKQR